MECALSRIGRASAHRIVIRGSGGFFNRNLLRSKVASAAPDDKRCCCPSFLIDYPGRTLSLNET
jgi:hypothetical protein